MRRFWHGENIIFHSIAFLGILLITLGFVLGQLFRRTDGSSFLATEPFTWSSWKRVLTYKADNIAGCPLPHSQVLFSDIPNLVSAQFIGRLTGGGQLLLSYKMPDSWRIARFDEQRNRLVTLVDAITYNGDVLTQSYGEVADVIAYPTCRDNACDLHFYSLSKGEEIRVLPAIGGIPYPPLPQIYNLFFDEKNNIVSYTTNAEAGSERFVVNWNGELLQAIDESPGTDRVLDFLGYLPDEDALVYRDSLAGNIYFYKTKEIGFYRAKDCGHETN